MTGFVLADREKLGPRAYRVVSSATGNWTAEGAWEQFCQFRAGSACYGPHGTHTLVLLSKEGK